MIILKRESPYLLEIHTEVYTDEIHLGLALKQYSKKKEVSGEEIQQELQS